VSSSSTEPPSLAPPSTPGKSNTAALWLIAALVAFGIVVFITFQVQSAKDRKLCNQTNAVIQNGIDSGVDTQLQPSDCG
jgi:hypothetical protein